MPLRLASVLLVPALFLLACQDDRQGPIDPGDRALEGAGACKFDDFVDNNPYTTNQIRNQKEGACRDALKAASSGDHTTAENLINQLQSSLSADYASCVGPPFGELGTCVLQAVGSNTLQETVAAFSKAICDLDPVLSQTGLDPDCLPATVATLASTDEGGTNPVWGGWIAFGPVGEASPTDDVNDAIVLPNGEFGIILNHLEPTEVFGAIRENPPTSVVGPCPEDAESEKNCEPSSYAIDLDTPDDFSDNDPIVDDPEGLYVEMCENVFDTGSPGRGADDEFNPVTSVDALGVLDCSKGGTAFAPSTWSILSEEDAVRTARFIVQSTSSAVSEGTVVKVFGPLPGTDQVGMCVTEATGNAKESACEVVGLDAAPGTLTYDVLAEKVEGSGSHSGTASFSLSVGDPAFGEIQEVEVIVGP